MDSYGYDEQQSKPPWRDWPAWWIGSPAWLEAQLKRATFAKALADRELAMLLPRAWERMKDDRLRARNAAEAVCQLAELPGQAERLMSYLGHLCTASNKAWDEMKAKRGGEGNG